MCLNTSDINGIFHDTLLLSVVKWFNPYVKIVIVGFNGMELLRSIVNEAEQH